MVELCLFFCWGDEIGKYSGFKWLSVWLEMVGVEFFKFGEIFDVCIEVMLS